MESKNNIRATGKSLIGKSKTSSSIKKTIKKNISSTSKPTTKSSVASIIPENTSLPVSSRLLFQIEKQIRKKNRELDSNTKEGKLIHFIKDNERILLIDNE